MIFQSTQELGDCTPGRIDDPPTGSLLFRSTHQRRRSAAALLWALLVLLTFSTGWLNHADASHLAGGQVTYTHVAGNTYQVELAIYRDCSGITLQNTQSMRLSPTNSGTVFTVTRTTITDITPLCPGQTSVCAGGTTPGREEHIYVGNVTLNPLPIGQTYTISWESCCRNSAITTLNSPASTGFYLATQLDPNQLQKNTSPEFLNPPIATLCAGQPAIISPNAVDANGDALVYSLTGCLDQGAVPVVYSGGFSATQPLSTNGAINLNTSTGALTFTPSTAGEVGVICLKVEEFRNGFKIGEIIRDIQVRVESCNNQPPVLTQVPNQVLQVGQQFCVNINATDADNDNISLTLSSAVGSFTVTNSSPGSASGVFCFTPTAANVGQTYTVTVQGLDNGCPAPAQGATTFNITVPVPCNAIATATGTDASCAGANDGSATVTTQNTTPPLQYTWSNGGSTPTITGLAPGTYGVTVVDGRSCVASTSVTIGGSTSPVSVSATTTGANCNQSNGSITAVASGGTGTYTYSLNGGTPQGSGSFSNLAGGTYTIGIVDGLGCTATTTVTVGNAPDVTPPVLVGLPSSGGNADCNAIPDPPIVTATDNCDGAVNVVTNQVIQPGNCSGNYTIIRTWSATDVAGNTANFTQTLNVSDNTPPVITCPANINQFNDPNQCGAIVNYQATATDDCGTVTITYSRAPGSFFNIGPVTVTATATDDCGNSSSCSFVVNVYDHDNPTIVCPADVSVACFSDVPAIDPGTVSGGDNCPGTTFGHVIDLDNNGLGCPSSPLVISRTYRAQDSTGNFADCIQTITVSDSIPPVISCPPTATVNCGDATDPSATGVATATDNCAGGGVNFNAVYGIADEAGNTNVNYCAFGPCQTSDPWGSMDMTIIGGNNFDVDIVLNQFWRISKIEYLVDEANNFGTPNGIPSVDASWNTVMVNDTNAYSLSFTGPALECAALGMRIEIGLESFFGGIDPNSVRNVYIFDANFQNSPNPTGNQFLLGYCVPPSAFGPVLSFNDVVTAGCGGTSSIARTWTTSDDCGNAASCTQTINVIDNVPPVIVCPPAVLVNCGDATDPAATGLATAVDNCAGGTGGGGSLNNTYSLADATGNTIVDFCGFLPCQAQDPWGAVTLAGSAGSYTASVTTDQFWFIQSVSFKLGATAADFTVNPPGSAPTVDGTWQTVPLATPLPAFSTQFNVPSGTCGVVGLVLELVRQDPFGGFDVNNPRTVYINDSNFGSSPNPTGTPFLAGFCIQGGATPPAVTFSDTFAAACGQTGTITRTFTATDDCGNSASCTQDIVVVDSTAPVVSCPANIVVNNDPGQCAADVQFAATATDACGSTTVSYDQGPGSFPVGASTVTATASDDCGNASTCSFTITVNDNEAPVVICPADTLLSCELDTLPPNTNLVQATDNCGIASVTFSGEVNNGGDGCPNDPLVFTRTYQATDINGNSALCTQLVSVIDSTPPMISCPSDTVISCATNSDPSVTGFPTTVENCELSFQNHPGSATHPGGLPCGTVLSYKLVDETGNQTTNNCVGCNGNSAPWGTAEVLNDSTDFIVYLEIAQGWVIESVNYKIAGPNGISILNGLPDVDPSWTTETYPIPERTRLIKMPLSNLPANCNIIGVEANIGYFSFFGGVLPASRTNLYIYDPIGMSSPNNPGSPLVTEYCPQPCLQTNYPTVSFNDQVISGTCQNEETIIRTWAAFDFCGNYAYCSQEIQVVDEIAPVISCPTNIVVANDSGLCAATVNFNVTATDNCDMTPTVTTTQASGSVFPVGTTTVAATATDNCGNVDTCAFTVTVNDTEAPSAICNDVTVQLDGTGLGSVTAADVDGGSSDNCGVASVSIDNGTFTCASIGGSSATPSAWINEFHYDNAGGDVGEFVEIAGTAGLDLTGWTVELYNGSTGLRYNVISLSGNISNQSNGFGTVGVNQAGIQNGAPDGLALVDDAGNVVEFLSYEGSFTASSAAASGLLSTDIGEEEGGGTPAGFSLQRRGIGSTAADFAWVAPDTASSGTVNSGQTFVPATGNVITLTVTDVNGNTSTCTSNVTIEDSVPPTAVCNDLTVQLDVNGVATIVDTDVDGGSTDNCSVASISIDQDTFDCASVGSNVVTLTVTDVNGNFSTCTANIAVEDNVAPTAICQDITVGLNSGGSASITAADIDNGSLDNCAIDVISLNQNSFDCADVGMAGPASAWINEFHYDNNGTDQDELVEVAGTAGLDLTGWSLVFYNGSNGSVYRTESLSGTLSNQNNGFGFAVVNLPSNGIQNGAPDGIALVDDNNNVIEFLSYEGTFTASAGPANGQTSTSVGVSETSATPVGFSLQRAGTGGTSAAFNFAAASQATAGAVNNGQTLVPTGGGVTVTLTVTDVNGNVDACNALVTVEDNVAPSAVCQDITVSLDGNGQATIVASDVDGGSADNCAVDTISIDNGNFDCSTIGANVVTLTVVDVNGNSSNCTANVAVEDNMDPVAVCQDVTVQLDGNGQATITVQDVDGGSTDNCSVSISISDSSFTCADVGTNAVVLVATDGSGNTDACTANVTVEDNVAPNAVCQDITVYLDNSGLVFVQASDIDGGSNDNCGIANISTNAFAYGCGSIGQNPAILTVTDVNGNVDTCNATITVLDTIPPSVTCQDITVSLDANGQVSIDAPDITASVSDNCGSVICSFDTNSVSQTDFTCADIGVVTVVLTASDVNGNTDTCQAQVTIVDSIPPVAVCQDITIQLDGNGQASITPADVDGGSTDNCDVFLSVSDSAFACADVGTNPVVLIATDGSGNTDACTANVTVEDNVAPNAVCQDITVQLDGNGQATIVAADVDGGSADNCAIDNLSIDNDTFDCASIGMNVVTLTVTDVNGNSSTCTANVTIEDNVAPTAVCQDVTVQLDGNGQGSITVQDVDGGSSDNCSVSLAISDSSFTCADVGTNPVVLIATDGSGNTDACTANVTVEDNVAPNAVCQDITVYLDNAGLVFVQASDIDGGSNDACGIANISTNAFAYGCGSIGPNPAILTVTDVNGNVDTCNATITVLDTIAPTVTCQDVTVSLDANGQVSIDVPDILGSTSDNCGSVICTFDTNAVSQTDFTCADIGIVTVVLTASDVNGNTDTCQAQVTIVDSLAPMAVCQDITLQLDANGQASITASDVDGGSSDNCGIDSISIDQSNFDCSTVGSNGVVLTVTDESGNSATCTATVTVEDNVAPTAVCQDLTVYLDQNGSVSISGADVDNGSSDNCAIDSMSVNPNTFDCSNVGSNSVTLTVTDAAGNSDACTASVEVLDTIAPTAVCQDITLQLDQNGFAVVTSADVDGGSFDNCDFTLETCDNPDPCVAVDFNTFPNGQPIPAGTNITTQLTGFGIAEVSASGGINQAWTFNSSSPTGGDFDLGTPNQQYGGPGAGNGGNSNNTPLGNLLIIQENNNTPDDNASGGDLNFTFTGPTLVESVTLVDIEENGGSITFVTTSGTVTVAIPATGNNSVQVLPINISNVLSMSVNLDGSGAIGGLNICNSANGSGCTSQFDCSDIGPNTVVLTATDASGNVDSCTATVTIEAETFVAISCPSDIQASCNNGQAPTVHWDAPIASAFSSCEAGCASDPHISGFHYLGEYNGHRYYRSNQSKHWDVAEVNAAATGGYLAVINSAGENQFLRNALGGSDYWIGFTDEATEGTWEWVNGDPVGYTNWNPGEPNNAGGSGPVDYAVLKGNNGRWYDRGGCSSYKYIVEVPCGPEVTVTQVAGPASGSTFQPGTTTTITYVATDTSGNADTCSFTVTVDDCPPNYCHAQAQCSNYEWISNVSFENVNNTTGNDGGYGDYTNLSATVAGGSSMSISLTPTFSGQSYTEYWRVWIDWNRDGDFNDQGEMAFQANGTGTVNGSIAVPSNAATGSLRMRVTMQWDQYAPNACCNFYYGEIEDYTLYVSGSARVAGGGQAGGAAAQASGPQGVTAATSRVDGPPAGFEFGRVFPNPVARASGGKVQVDYRSGRDEDISIRVMDLYGQVLYTRNVAARLGVNSTELNVSELPAGTYFIEVTNEAGKRTEKLVIQ